MKVFSSSSILWELLVCAGGAKARGEEGVEETTPCIENSVPRHIQEMQPLHTCTDVRLV